MKPLSEKRAFNKLAKELRKERKKGNEDSQGRKEIKSQLGYSRVGMWGRK